MRPKPTQAIERFRPFFEGIVRAVQEGVRRLGVARGALATQGAHPNKRSTRALLHSLVSEAARAHFDGIEEVNRDTRDPEHDLFQLKDQHLFGFKLAVRGVARNHASARQDRLRHTGQLEFGFRKPTWVVVLYKLDSTFSELLDVRLASPKGYASNHWSHSILDEVRGVVGLPLKAERTKTSATKVESKTKIGKRRTAE